jgi:hypothetical protein
MLAMATKQTRAAAKEMALDDNARFQAWLKDFDARQAQLDAVLYSLGVNPDAGRGTA